MDRAIPVIGMMSGTSVDAVDAALVLSDGERLQRTGHHVSLAWPEPLRRAIFAVIDDPGRLADVGERQKLDQAIAGHHLEAARRLMRKYDGHVRLIGMHGQTVLHQAQKKISVQLGDPRYLADGLGVPVACRFRQNDLDHGGQGAPLAPVYHRALAAMLDAPIDTMFVNIGGIANATFITEKTLTGFDTGPGGAMMDRLMLAKGGLAYDRDGALAASGTIDETYVDSVLGQDWFHKPPPKSLDRVEIETMLNPGRLDKMVLADALASLVAVSARALAMAMRFAPEPPRLVILAGGGAKNRYLVEQIRRHIGAPVRLPVRLIDEIDESGKSQGINGTMIEAELVAFLAVRCLKGLAITFPQTTGVSQPQTGGVIVEPSG